MAAGCKYDTIGTNHFFGATIDEDYTFGGIVLFECDDFGVSKNHDTKFASEIIGDTITDVFVLAGEQTGRHFEDDDFDSELGIVGGDFATGGATSNNHNDLWGAVNLDGGFGGEIINLLGAGYFKSF